MKLTWIDVRFLRKARRESGHLGFCFAIAAVFMMQIKDAFE